MCPLRIILIFLSATLAGFFLLRNLNSQTADFPDAAAAAVEKENNPLNSSPLSSKVYGAIGKGFWTFVDMASGRYLWKNLFAVSSSSSPSPSDSYLKLAD